MGIAIGHGISIRHVGTHVDTWTSCGILAVVSALGCMIFELKKNATRITRCVFLGKTTELKMKNNTSNPSQSYLKTKKRENNSGAGWYIFRQSAVQLIAFPPSVNSSVSYAFANFSQSQSVLRFCPKRFWGKNHGLGD